MRSALILITIFIFNSSFANERKLLECSDRHNSIIVSVNDESKQVSIFRNSWQRELVYVDRKDQSETSPVIVNGYENLEYSALLSNANAVVNGQSVEITFEDKRATKLKMTVENVKEGVGLSITSANKELIESILGALVVSDPSDLSFYSSNENACILGQ